MLNSTRALFFILFLILGFSNNAISQNEKPFYDLKVNIHPDEHYLEVEGVISFPSSMVQENKLVLLHATDTKGLDMTGANLKNFDSAVNNGLANYTLLFNEDTQDSIHLDLSYSLAIPTNHKINRITPEWIELNLDSFWQPIFASIPNIDYKVSVTLGGDYTLLSGDQYRKVGTGRYIIRNSISRRDIPFSAGQHLREVNGSLANSYSPLDSVDLQSIVDKSDHILAFLREYTNQIDDFDQPRRVIISPREEVGYSRKNYIVMSDVRSMSDTYLSDYLAHEFSHYWFSNANFQTKHHWLTETFAEFVSMIYMRDTFGEDWYEEDLASKRERIKDDPKTLSEFEGRPSFAAMYIRGPLVLNTFEKYIGQDRFQKLIQAFIKEDVRTNEELFSLIEKEFDRSTAEKLQELLASI